MVRKENAVGYFANYRIFDIRKKADQHHPVYDTIPRNTAQLRRIPYRLRFLQWTHAHPFDSSAIFLPQSFGRIRMENCMNLPDVSALESIENSRICPVGFHR
jgi:hypothetical protein